jgi:hypothetical protein
MLVVVAAACGPSEDPAGATPGNTPESMKGYELYGWQDDGRWYFSLLTGTNREKTLDEIKAPDSVLEGFEALQRAVDGIASGQQVTLLPTPAAVFPPQNVIEMVEQLCEDHELVFAVAR